MEQQFFTEEQAIGLLRDAKGGMSQAQFAEELGIPQQALNDAMRGKRRIPEAALKKIGLRSGQWMYELDTAKGKKAKVKRGK